ncbi:MAG: hypothetical protein K9L32_00390 [Chromatiaceae bacterium]|nr:hypothetical protein [Chromatiaceae bacterium]MCF8002663.1 hypothetical protein [Chromatiaceae bacterium]
MPRDEATAYALKEVANGESAPMLARSFLTHYEGREPSTTEVLTLAREWQRAAIPGKPKPTITQARKRLLAEGLAGLVDEHRAIGKQRLLRFKPEATAEQRFAVYRALGLARDTKPLPKAKRSQPATQPKSAPSTNRAPSAA